MIHQLTKRFHQYKTQLFTFADQGVVSGGNFLLGVLLARTLGLEVYGQYALCWLVVLFWSSLQNAWIISPMFTFLPTMSESKKKAYLMGLLMHQLVLAALAAVLTYGFVLLAKGQFADWKSIAGLTYLPFVVFGFLVYDFFRRIYYVDNNYMKAFYLDIVIYLFQGIGLMYISFYETIDLPISFLLVGSSYGVAVISGFVFVRKYWNSSYSFFEVFEKHWKFSRWLLGTSLLQWLSGNFFIIAAAGLLSPAAVGAIRILQNVVGVLNVLFLAYENYFPAKASKVFQEQGLSVLKGFFRKHLLQGLVVTAVLVGVMAVFGKEIIDFLYGREYIGFAYLLYGFAVLYLLIFVGTIMRFAFRTFEVTRPLFIAYILNTLLSLALAKPIILWMGIDGVVLGLILSQVLVLGYFVFELRVCLNQFKIS